MSGGGLADIFPHLSRRGHGPSWEKFGRPGCTADPTERPVKPVEPRSVTGKSPVQPAEGAGGGRCPLVSAAIYTIFEGTSEIQRLVIARTLSGMPIR